MLNARFPWLQIILMLFLVYKRFFFVLLVVVLAGLGLFLVSGFWMGQVAMTLPSPKKPRVLILTDITSLKEGYLEPDDGQSLIRLMLYTNDLEIEGLIASSNLGHGQRVQPDLIHQVIDAYAMVQPRLVQHDPAYPSAAHLHSQVKSGQPKASPKVPITTSFGEGLDTEASEWIIRVVDQPDTRPVWVCIWGGSADLAQALWKMQQTRSKDAVQMFVRKLRVRAISDQDSTGRWIRQQFPDLFYVYARHCYRGMYRGGNTQLTDSVWVANQIHNSANPLGMLYPNYVGGDIWSGQLGRVKGTKEGDTPSFLGLIPNGLNMPEQPELGSWGGLYAKNNTSYYQDKVDSTANYATDRTPYMASVYRWRPDWQNDFLTRLQWCVRSYRNANHHPKAVVNGNASDQPILQVVRAGTTIRFDAQQSSDPERQALRFHWQVYPQTAIPGVVLLDVETARLKVQVESTVRRQTIPILLTVTDTGQPALRHYRRVILQVN